MGKQIKAVQRLIQIHADSNGELPSRIHLLSTGHWHTPWHGAFEMTPSDLAEMVVNFEDGIGMVKGSKKLPINYGHDVSGKAAGWMTGLSLENSGTELWGDVEWTPEGKRMLADGEFRYISPEWNPREFPWQNPEDESQFVNNVLCGAGLTNIPLFKKLTPVMASVATGSEVNKEGDDMTLKDVRAKKPEDLTDEEKAFLEEHKDELTDDERQAFGLVDSTTADDDTDSGDADDDDDGTEPATTGKAPAPVTASTKGQVTISASELKALKASAQQGVEAATKLLRTEMTTAVKASVDTGAIKADQLEAAVELLMASEAKQRDKLLAFIAALPENKLVTAGELGHSQDLDTVTLTASEKEYATAFNLTEADVLEFKKSKLQGDK